MFSFSFSLRPAAAAIILAAVLLFPLRFGGAQSSSACSSPLCTVSAAHVTDASGNPLNGTIVFVPTDMSGVQIPFHVPGLGQGVPVQTSAPVTAGSFSLSLADSTQTSPANLCYRAYITDRTGRVISGSNTYNPNAPLQCVQMNPSWCTGNTCSFDNYAPGPPVLTQYAATTSKIGGVSVPTAGGLAVDNSGNLSVSPPATGALWTGCSSANPLMTYTGVCTVAAAGVNADWNATSGLAQILNKPVIPPGQVNSDWSATSGLAQILNKPTIPAAQVQSDWNATTGLGVILNKPSLLVLGTTANTALPGNTYIPPAQVNSDWSASSGLAQILNKPTIPAAQVQSDWNATTGLGVILNKPSLLVLGNTATTALPGNTVIPPGQVNSDWTASSGLAQILNKPTIPAAQVQSDWNATSGLGAILNKPALGTAAYVATSAFDASGAAAAAQAAALAASLQKANNLSDLLSAATARTNLGLGSAATQNSSAFDAAGAAASAQAAAIAASDPAGSAASAQTAALAASLQKANNLSDLSSASAARTNLGLGTAATTASTAYDAAGAAAAAVAALPTATNAAKGLLASTDWTTFNSKQAALGYTPLNPANNLSDLPAMATARTNLGLGTAATTASTAYDAAGAAAAAQAAAIAASDPVGTAAGLHALSTTATGTQTLSGPLSVPGAVTVTTDSASSAGSIIGSGANVTNYLGISGARSTFGYGLARSTSVVQASTGHGIDFNTNNATFGSGTVGGYSYQGFPFLYEGTSIASATTIAPITAVTHITGTTAISTITVPSGCTTSTLDCTVTLIPDGAWSTVTGGNIAVAASAVVGVPIAFTYDPSTSLWYGATNAGGSGASLSAANTWSAAQTFSGSASAVATFKSSGGAGTAINIDSGASGQNATLQFLLNGSSTWRLWNSSSGALRYSDNTGSDYIVLISGGNVSLGTGYGTTNTGAVMIGTASPTTGTKLQVNGATATIALSTPGAPTVTPTGTTGSASYSYTVVANQSDGSHTVAGSAGSTTTGNATLSATNYNALSWTTVNNAYSYTVYRTVGGATQGAISTAQTATTLNDTGLTASGSAPTTNTTGSLTVGGPLSAASATITGSLIIPTQTAGDNSTLAASDAFVQTAVATKQAALGYTPLNPSSNLSDLANASTARTNLGLGTAATVNGANVAYPIFNSNSYGNGSTNGIQTAVAACGSSVSCSVLAAPTYGSTETSPCPLNNVGSYSSTTGCNYTMSSNVVFEDSRYGIRYRLNVDGGPYGSAAAPNYKAFDRVDRIDTTSAAGTIFESRVGRLTTEYALGGGVNVSNGNTVASLWPNKAFYIGNDVRVQGYAAGQKIGNQSFVNSYGVGDALGYYAINTCYGGFSAGSDEACEAMDIQATEGTVQFTGSVSAVTSNTVSVTVSAGDGTQGEGRFLIDTQPSVTLNAGTILSIGSPANSSTPLVVTGSGTSWPVSTAMTNATTATNGGTNATITVGSTTGITTSSNVCIADPYYMEQATPSAVNSGTGVITFANLRYPHTVGAYLSVGGLACRFLRILADDATNTRFPSLAYTLTNPLWYVIPIVNSTSATTLNLWLESPNNGFSGYRGKWSATANTYAIYPGAQVTSVMQSQKLSSTLTVETAAAFTAGDAVVQPLYHNLNVYEALHSVQRTTPQIGGSNPAAWWLQLNGLWTDFDTAFQITNNTPLTEYATAYGGSGGTKSPPIYMHPAGLWDKVLYFSDTAPNTVIDLSAANSANLTKTTDIVDQQNASGKSYFMSDPGNHRWMFGNYFNGNYLYIDATSGSLQTTGKIYAGGYVTSLIETGLTTNNDLAGVLTMSGGTQTYSFTGGYTNAPVCTANDASAIAPVRVQTSNTTLTVSTTGSSDVVSYICIAKY